MLADRHGQLPKTPTGLLAPAAVRFFLCNLVVVLALSTSVIAVWVHVIWRHLGVVFVGSNILTG